MHILSINKSNFAKKFLNFSSNQEIFAELMDLAAVEIDWILEKRGESDDVYPPNSELLEFLTAAKPFESIKIENDQKLTKAIFALNFTKFFSSERIAIAGQQAIQQLKDSFSNSKTNLPSITEALTNFNEAVMDGQELLNDKNF